jgi:hypothetical protein
MMNSSRSSETTDAHDFEIKAPKYPFGILVKVYIILALVFLGFSPFLAIGMLVGGIVGVVGIWLFRNMRNSFRVFGSSFFISKTGNVTQLDLTQLVVSSNTKFNLFKPPKTEFNSRSTREFVVSLGSSYGLMPEAVLILAHLQKRGAFIDVLGYGTFIEGAVAKRIQTENRIIPWEVCCIVYGLFFMPVVWSNYDRVSEMASSARGPSPMIISPFVLPATVALTLAWTLYTLVLSIRAVGRMRGLFRSAIEVAGDRVKRLKWNQVLFDLHIDEIKVVNVTVIDKGFDRDTISVDLETHYARKHKVVDNYMYLPLGVNNFLEFARRKGVTVVYQKLRKGADVPDVIWEAKAEKAQDPVESTEAQFTGPSETQVRQTEG